MRVLRSVANNGASAAIPSRHSSLVSRIQRIPTPLTVEPSRKMVGGYHSDPSYQRQPWAGNQQDHHGPSTSYDHYQPSDDYRPAYRATDNDRYPNSNSDRYAADPWRYDEPGPSNYYQDPYHHRRDDRSYDNSSRLQTLRSASHNRPDYPSRRATPERWGAQDTYRPSRGDKPKSVYVPPHRGSRTPQGSLAPAAERRHSPFGTVPQLSTHTQRNGTPANLPLFPPNIPYNRPKSPFRRAVGNANQQRDMSTQTWSDAPARRSRHSTPPPPAVQLPPAEYLELSRPTQESIAGGRDVVPKLLVLDLNGALVYRNRSGSQRKPYPRPYLSCFLQYLFLPEPNAQTDSPKPWEVFIWSSAQPHNVRAMVEAAFGNRWIEGIWEQETPQGRQGREEGEGRVLGVWARDKMGLNSSDYSRKVQTTKDLRKVIDHLYRPPDSTTPHRDFDERTTVLLDDSPMKAVYQPWNQLIIPEFDKQEYQDSRSAACALEEGRVEENDASSSGMDRILLGVIGVLDELRTVANVPAWIRAGGLYMATPHLGDREFAGEPTVDSLPSHESFVHWFKDPVILALWISRGKDALQRKGIQIHHGLEVDKSATPNRESSKVEKAVANDHHQSSRGWSPSRPSSPYSLSDSDTAQDDAVDLIPRRLSSEGMDVDDQETVAGPIDAEDKAMEPTEPAPQTNKNGRKSWQKLRSVDVALYLNDIIEKTSALSTKERDQLRSARDIISGLPPIIAAEVTGHGDVGTTSAKSGKRGDQFKLEYEAARALQPSLTKSKYKKDRKTMGGLKDE